MSTSVKAKKDKAPEKSKPAPVAQRSSPDLPRLLSVSAIIVALAVAGALAIEGAISRDRNASMVETVAIPQPDPAPKFVRTEADKLQLKQLERRTSLLERQIVVLQIELAAEQKKGADLKAQLSALDTKVTDLGADPDTSMKVAVAAPPEPEAKPEPKATKVAPEPQKQPEAKPEPKPDVAMAEELEAVPAQQNNKGDDPADDMVLVDKTTPKPQEKPKIEAPADPIVTGSIDPDAKPEPVKAPAQQDIAALVKPEVRASKPTTISHTHFAVAFDLHDTVDDVKAAWKKLEAAQPKLVGELEARALPQGTQEGKLKYRLLAGPFTNAAAATRRCAKLQRYGIKCRTKVFGGEALETPPSPGTLIKVEVVADTDETDAAPEPEKKVRAAHMEALLAKRPVPRSKPVRLFVPR